MLPMCVYETARKSAMKKIEKQLLTWPPSHKNNAEWLEMELATTVARSQNEFSGDSV
jgi:hypothetical protein